MAVTTRRRSVAAARKEEAAAEEEAAAAGGCFLGFPEWVRVSTYAVMDSSSLKLN